MQVFVQFLHEKITKYIQKTTKVTLTGNFIPILITSLNNGQMFSDSQEMQLFWLSLGSKFAVCTSFIVPRIQKTLSYMVPWTLANELGFAQRRITSHNLAIILTVVFTVRIPSCWCLGKSKKSFSTTLFSPCYVRIKSTVTVI